MNSEQENLLEARTLLLKEIRREFLGPEGETVDIFTENPVKRYSTGMLFPKGYESRSPDAAEKDVEASDEVRDALPDKSEEEEGADIGDAGAALASSFYPSAMGLSFYCLGKDPELKVKITWATYRKVLAIENFIEIGTLPEEVLNLPGFTERFELKGVFLFSKVVIEKPELKPIVEQITDKSLVKKIYKLAEHSKNGWIRVPGSKEIKIDAKFKHLEITQGLELVCNRRYPAADDTTLFTIAAKDIFEACPTASGMDEQHVFFQVALEISSTTELEPIFIEYASRSFLHDDEEEQSLALLYRNKQTYAVGHGCSANWHRQQGVENAEMVFTEVIPTYEVPQAIFEIEGVDQQVLDMRNLCGEASFSDEEIIAKLKDFCTQYKEWIDGLAKDRSVPVKLKPAAARHIGQCEEAYSRMVRGIEILQNDATAFKSFQLANKAMLMQSLHGELQKVKREPGDSGPINWPDYKAPHSYKGKWRPFQIAFLLLSIRGVTDPESEDRSLADLIWFPTGGGKTEAYLGLAAFTIFFRRLKYGVDGGGTSIMMRYTLRLLTAQQFQRACTLICAMEQLRRDGLEKLGGEEISIGLWVGGASTANTIEDAEERLQQFQNSNYGGNPSTPILSCPWCGTKMIKMESTGRRRYAAKVKSRPKKQFNLFCFEKQCPFNERLPVLIVDDDIYSHPPTLLFGTVDKFAQMPLKKGVSSIFATNEGSTTLPPELIIQDELHLISGALGTIVGLYETAVDFLCSRKGRRPKVIASTATVRRAEEQCRNIFDRDIRQFPPPGLDISDSFFSREAPLGTLPGRLYAGLMASGKTQTTAAVRLTAALVRAVYRLPYDDSVKDKYWTLVSYFNSIRELGGFISLAQDDIPMYSDVLNQRYTDERMRYVKVTELTSRKKAEDIPETLEQLFVSHPDRRAIDILAATNMISVGVDIDRLGLMVIRGQPKLTSEYIQVSSRIGRRHPGLVFPLYNSARTRDRAHYERFITYHQSFYRYVEPSSVTPFSSPARARALRAVLVTMVRHGLGIPELVKESGASQFSLALEHLDELRKYILERVTSIDNREAEVTREEVDRLFKEWQLFAEANLAAASYKYGAQGPHFLGSFEGNDKGRWAVPNSMRNVDVECNIDIVEDD